MRAEDALNLAKAYVKKTMQGMGAIQGKDGKDGVDGKDGADGTDGKDGKSAYEIATDNGVEGTEQEWLESLKGKDGQDGVDGKDGKDGQDGKDGDGAIEISKEADNQIEEKDDGIYVPPTDLSDYAKTEEVNKALESKADVAVEAAVTKLNADSATEGSVDYKIAQAVAAIMENPDDTMNSINELVTWINDHATDALELSNKVSANEANITALKELVGDEAVAKQITDAITSALTTDGVDKYALATDLTKAVESITANKEALEGKQDKLSGAAGQYVGFDDEGKAVAVEAPTGGEGGTSETVQNDLIVTCEYEVDRDNNWTITGVSETFENVLNAATSGQDVILKAYPNNCTGRISTKHKK